MDKLDMRTVLYNAISLLIDETWDQYDGDSKQEWFEMLQNELGVTAAELEEMGIKITVDGGLETVKEFDEKGYPHELVDNTFGRILEQEAASRLGCGVRFNGFNVTDGEIAYIAEKMKKTPQAFLDVDFIEAFCAEQLYVLRGLDPDKISAMQGELSQLYDELQGAEIYDPGAADNIARVLHMKADALEAYITGKSVEQPGAVTGRDMIYLLSGVHNTRFGADSFAFMFHDKGEALDFKVTDNIVWREDERDEDEWIEYRVAAYQVTGHGFEFVETVYESGFYYASDEIDREAEVSLAQRLESASERSGKADGNSLTEMERDI